MSQYLKRFQLDYPALAAEMRGCSHHYDEKTINPFHLEGDIWSHTCMVTKQLEGTTLEMAAVLHDIGKVYTRYENHEKQRVRFSGHENMSAFMSLKIFKDWDINQVSKEFMFKLIALHGEPYRLELAELNKRLTNEHSIANDLYYFGKADHIGRFHEGEDNHIHQYILPDMKISNKENFTKEVVFLIGLPGSGKSTYREANYRDYFWVSRDDIILVEGARKADKAVNYNDCWDLVDQQEIDRKLQACIQRAAVLESKVIIDMTNLTKKQRLQKLKFFKDFKKKAIVLLPTLETTYERLEGRANKTIPQKVIKNMIMGFVPPGYDEFDEIEWRFE